MVSVLTDILGSKLKENCQGWLTDSLLVFTHLPTKKFDFLNRSVAYCRLFYTRSVVLASLRTLSSYSTTVRYDSLCAMTVPWPQETWQCLSTASILNILRRPRFYVRISNLRHNNNTLTSNAP